MFRITAGRRRRGCGRGCPPPSLDGGPRGACRRSALAESEVEWPVYCALDEVTEVRENGTNLGHQVSDFNWVDAGPVTTRAKQLKCCPYQGPRWSSRLATPWCLKRGIIRWDDIKLGYSASWHLSKDFFKPLLKQLREAFGDEALYK